MPGDKNGEYTRDPRRAVRKDIIEEFAWKRPHSKRFAFLVNVAKALTEQRGGFEFPPRDSVEANRISLREARRKGQR